MLWVKAGKFQDSGQVRNQTNSIDYKSQVSRTAGRYKESFRTSWGASVFCTVVLQKKSPMIKFPNSEQEKSIPLEGSGGRPNFVDLDIPANTFLTANGRLYTGEITASIGVVDPRSEADVTAASGDFSAIDDNGEVVALGSVGMLRQVL